jgi:hypothetical protein
MNYRTHNDGGPQHGSGCCLRGYCPEGTTYERLVDLFGPPLGPSADDKVDWEWIIEFEDGIVATIYNWKDGPSYGGAGASAERSWHIGGYYQEPQGLAVEHVLEVLERRPEEELRRLWKLADEGDANAIYHLEHFGGAAEHPMALERVKAKARVRERLEGRKE